MKKLSLDLESLEVETFDPEAPLRDRSGSVAAYEVLPTYDPRNVHCYFSFMVDPGEACTPVCHTGAECILTSDCAG
jgi:hypothetical protein